MRREFDSLHIYHFDSDWRSWQARLLDMEKVVGSNPTSETNFTLYFRGLFAYNWICSFRTYGSLREAQVLPSRLFFDNWIGREEDLLA